MTDWRNQAACRGVDGELFFSHAGEGGVAGTPDRRIREAVARSYCNACPVTTPCLQYALAMDAVGYWAGTNEDDRKRLKKAARTPARKGGTVTTGQDLTRQTGPVHWHAPGEPARLWVASTGDGADTPEEGE